MGQAYRKNPNPNPNSNPNQNLNCGSGSNTHQKHLADEQLATLHASFLKRFSGSEVSEANFIRFYHEVYADSLRNPLVTHLLRRIECKKPGIIHIDDFLDAFATVRRGSADECKEWIFSLYADSCGLADKLEILELVRTAYRVSYSLSDGLSDKSAEAHNAEERMRHALFADQTPDRHLNKTAFKEAWNNNEDILQVIIETLLSLLQELFDGMRKSLAESAPDA